MKYRMQVPISGFLYIDIEASNEKDAIKKTLIVDYANIDINEVAISTRGIPTIKQFRGK